MANANSGLHSAKRNKKDEFYTQIVDIEREMSHYRRHFKGKVVYCNCDDPYVSAFFEYFTKNFDFLAQKKLITTCYKSQRMDLFSKNDSEEAIKLEYTGGAPNSLPTPDDIGVTPLTGDGDFRSEECIAILKEADIVVTNPPFSLFSEYVKQLAGMDKKFIIIGHQNAITYKDVFPFIKENKVWLGYGFKRNMAHFIAPHYEDTACDADHRDGMIRVSGVVWYTNLDHNKRHEELILVQCYRGNETAYPRYDNYDAIEVSKTQDIPFDYEGIMGVPITFLTKYNPEQFEIVGMCENEDLYGLKSRTYTSSECKLAYLHKFGKKGTYDLNASGVVIRNGLYEKVYQRLLIRNRKP